MAKSPCRFAVVGSASPREVFSAVIGGRHALLRVLRPATGHAAVANGRGGLAAPTCGLHVAAVTESRHARSHGLPVRSEAIPVTERAVVVGPAIATPTKAKHEGQVAAKKGRALKKAPTSQRD